MALGGGGRRLGSEGYGTNTVDDSFIGVSIVATVLGEMLVE